MKEAVEVSESERSDTLETETPSEAAAAAPVSAPDPTDTPEPMATPEPEPTATLEPTSTATPVPASTDTVSSTATQEPTLTVAPEPTLEATEVPTPVTTLEPTATQVPAPTASPGPTATQVSAPSAIPTSSLTPEPTALSVTPPPAEQNAVFESGYAHVEGAEEVCASPSGSAEVLGTLERDSVIYVIEGVSERWLKAVLAYEHQGEQIAEGYLREEAIVPEEDQTGTAAAIQSGRYVTCSAYGGITLPLVSFVKTPEEKDEADDTPQDDELAAPARLQHGQNMPEDAAMADAQALSTPLNPAETATVMLTDEDTQVTIDDVAADVRASISVVEADKEVLEAALNETGLTLRNAVCYDSTLWQGETQYQPTDALTVTLPVPLRWGERGVGKGAPGGVAGGRQGNGRGKGVQDKLGGGP